MNCKERLKYLIDHPKDPSVSEWVYEVESFLEEIDERNEEAWELIDKIKIHSDRLNHCENLVALLRQIWKKRYENINIPPIKEPNQVFVAMWFDDSSKQYYELAYKPVIEELNYKIIRIDEKIYLGSVIGEIKAEIESSKAIIADLTGNRGGVYYEAGIATGLQLCNHPIKLILTCQKKFFNEEKVHFDVSGDYILIYEDVDDLKEQLRLRLKILLAE